MKRFGVLVVGSIFYGLMVISMPASGNEQARAGAQVVLSMCTSCHGLKYVQYSDLAALGLPSDEIDLLRGDRVLSDGIQSLTPPEDAKMAYGVVPPDLSLVVAARQGGERYVYDYLVGYAMDEQGNTLNRVYPGTRMPDIFGISAVDDPAYRAEIESSVRNVSAFLAWAADPNKQTREWVGYGVLGYLFLLTLMLYGVKRRVWRTLPPPVETS